MTRNLLWLLILLAMVGLLVFVSHVSAVKSDSPTGYRPLAGSQFVSLSPSVGAGRVAGSPDSPRATSSVLPSALPTPTTPRSASPAPKPSTRPHLVSGPSVAGISTWYRYIPGQAAAAKALRAFLGPDWRGMTVRVCASDQQVRKCLSVVLTDYESSTIPGRLIDLDASDFAAICGPLSIGVCPVTVVNG